MTRSSARKSAASEGVASVFRTQHPTGVEDLPTAKLIATKLIESNPFQPRHHFDQGALKELATSIREHGVLQPLVVRRVDQRYQIIAGERRLRAATLAGLQKVPCVTRALADDEMELLALLENIQRADLDPLDEAHAYQRLMEWWGLSLRDLATRVHKSHTHIAGRLRLLADPAVEEAVRAGKLGPTAAQELARVEDPERRSQLIARARGGTRVTVQDVKGTSAQRHPVIDGSVESAPSPPAKVEGYFTAPGPAALPDQLGAGLEGTASELASIPRTPAKVEDYFTAAAPAPTAPVGDQQASTVPATTGADVIRLDTLAIIRLRQQGDAAPRADVLLALWADLDALEGQKR